MSFLHPSRLSFAGKFQADVSTVNNDVRHYDDATFSPNFQQLQAPDNLNGWWNPTGSGAYRFVNCSVTGVGYADGSWESDPAADPAIGLTVAGAGDRTSGKLVDIDPQWQLASAPWGLAVRLLSGSTEVLGGNYKSHAFRDLWFSRCSDPNVSGDAAASATFQSVIEATAFDDTALAGSRALREIRQASSGDRLSIRLTTFGYDADATSPTFTLGTMIGTIGPYLADEPESFVLGRRFAPAAGFASYGASITYFSAVLHPEPAALLLDLSNALQVSDAAGTLTDFGALSVGVLTDDHVAANTPVTEQNYQHFDDIPYLRPGWLAATGGVVQVSLTPEQYRLAAEHPLALVYQAPLNPGGNDEGGTLGVVAIRETMGGLFAGAEPAVHRIDAGESSPVTFYAARYGVPQGGQQLQVRQIGKVPGQGAGPDSPQTKDIPVPDMGVPTTALTVPAVTTDSDGRRTVSLEGSDPGNPRGYLDGQMYLIDYRLPGQSNTSRQPFDYVVVHLRDAYQVPDKPTWEADVKPILTQFSNLYPIMSQQFIDLTDPASVVANRSLLQLAFSRHITDPNYMPVTRDLSGPKRAMLLRWFEGLDDGIDPSMQQYLTAPPEPGHRPGLRNRAAEPAAAQAVAEGGVGSSSVGSSGSGSSGSGSSSGGIDVKDSKTLFADNFLNPRSRS
jgi:hypothetical protein